MTRPIPNSIAALQPLLTEWRRDLHAHPEIGFEVHRTAGLVAARLRDFGFDEVTEGVGRTGVVGVLHGADGPAACPEGRILLRADMDALPMQEEGRIPHASTLPGAMHACGHDGHTTMLLGAAKHLAETREFSGSLVFVFQPAEEGDRGMLAMLTDGLLDRWPARAAFGLHIVPGAPVGAMATRKGPLLAYSDRFRIVISGKGGHAAYPDLADDVIVAGAAVVQGLQTLISRWRDPMNPALISITRFAAGSAYNVLPMQAELWGTVRALDPELVAPLLERMRLVCESTAAAHGATAHCELGVESDPVTWNDPGATDLALAAMREVVGDEMVEPDCPAELGGEDFSWLTERLPSNFTYIGNGESAPVHHPEFDFNDEVLPVGVAYWARLAEMALPRG